MFPVPILADLLHSPRHSAAGIHMACSPLTWHRVGTQHMSDEQGYLRYAK